MTTHPTKLTHATCYLERCLSDGHEASVEGFAAELGVTFAALSEETRIDHLHLLRSIAHELSVCPCCEGEGGGAEDWDEERGEDYGRACLECGGSGRVADLVRVDIHMGDDERNLDVAAE